MEIQILVLLNQTPFRPSFLNIHQQSKLPKRKNQNFYSLQIWITYLVYQGSPI